MHGLQRSARIGAAGLLTAGLLAAAGSAAPVASATPPCISQTLPGLHGGDGEAEVISISDAGLYGGDARTRLRTAPLVATSSM